MGSSPWQQGTRSRSLKRIWPWLALLGVLGMVRWSKGAGFADGYALLTRPFWPGSAQKQWIQAAQQQDDIMWDILARTDIASIISTIEHAVQAFDSDGNSNAATPPAAADPPSRH